MNLLQDIITYVRRIVKTPNNSVITDNLIIDYINRFWLMDVDARVQLFDLKTTYQFQTQPGVDKYNMPLYNVQTQPGAQDIGMYPVYQGMVPPAFINGIQVPLQTQKRDFYLVYPNIVQQLGQVATGDGTVGPYMIQFPILPGIAPPNPPINGILRGHVDISGIIALGNATGENIDPPRPEPSQVADYLSLVPTTSVESAVYITTLASDGSNMIVADSGQFLSTNVNCGILMTPGNAPFGNTALGGAAYSETNNIINYLTGECYVTFPDIVPSGNAISAQCFFFQSGIPLSILYYDNVLTFRSPPDTQYLVSIEGYLSPCAFLNTSAAIPFGYMSEYIARGAARKILSDTGDVEQFQFYEPLFLEQEQLVWKRSQREFTSTRTETLYSQGLGQSYANSSNIGGGYGV